MQLLTEQIEQLIIGYAPPIELSHIPLHPIRTVVVLYLTATDGFRYVGNLELMLTRPIYGRTDESPILGAGAGHRNLSSPPPPQHLV